MDWLVSLALFFLGLCCVYFFTCFKTSSLPPGPLPWPIVGSLFSLRMPLHQHFVNLGKRYGPIIYLKIGMVPFLIVNNAEMAEQVLKIHDQDFAHRPDMELFKIFSFGYKDLVFSPPGREWRKMRRIASMHLFSNNMLNSPAVFLKSELRDSMAYILQQKRVNLTHLFEQLISNSLCLTLFSKKGLKVVEIINSMVGRNRLINIGDVIPALDRFDLHGIHKRMNSFLPLLKGIIEKEIEEHKERKHQAGDGFVIRDFTDVLISLEEHDQLPDISIIALLVDMVSAGLHTTRTMLDWAMVEIVSNKDVMYKAQEEIDNVVGRMRMVDKSDLQSLHYIQAIVKETLRMHPALPLAVPHYNVNDASLGGYKIPAGCKVLVNIWAIGRDEAYWCEPHLFRPERFLGTNINITGQHFQFIPFSAGRRICAGYPLAMQSISLVLASLIQVFDWSCIEEIDMGESNRQTVLQRSSDLVLKASLRPGTSYMS